MEIDCRADMQTAKRLVMEAISDIVNGDEFNAEDLNDLHHALEALEIIQRIECKDKPAPETPPASGGTGGNGNGNGGTSHPAADLTGIMAGMERLLGMVSQLVIAVTQSGGNGNGGGSTPMPMPPTNGGNGETAPETGNGNVAAPAKA